MRHLPDVHQRFYRTAVETIEVMGATIMHPLDTPAGTYRCVTPYPLTQCRCGYYDLIWVEQESRPQVIPPHPEASLV